ncbi:endonuclease/exonuclease/phosphatase family protein [Bartonella sp. TP]|uniref:endonuclease/exonuclease/phosphatase family protein n=1 Tax=Bartonella sp. TP TaxID=3057550 RepID=UPI0025B05FB5|nr:endonuclease/exonuclease/phosphatase family protein [Bartonella sp. TP]WJW80529.1 endonuclease/exonuclease/phosphatase family protein [Bartonella sp. TP]
MPQITIASYNIHKCVGVDGVFSPERIVAVIKECDADIIALQEVDKRFGKRETVIDPIYLQQETGLYYAPLKTKKPASLGWHGNAIFYKNVELITIEQIELPGLEPRGALFAIFKKLGICFCVISAHFGLLHKSRKDQVKTILEIFERKYAMPSFLIGDFNEWRKNARSSLHSLTDHFHLHPSHKASFPARYPIFSLDRIFASKKDMLLYTSIHNSKLAKTASDHLPIKARVHLQPSTQQPIEIDAMAS